MSQRTAQHCSLASASSSDSRSVSRSLRGIKSGSYSMLRRQLGGARTEKPRRQAARRAARRATQRAARQAWRLSRSFSNGYGSSKVQAARPVAAVALSRRRRRQSHRCRLPARTAHRQSHALRLRRLLEPRRWPPHVVCSLRQSHHHHILRNSRRRRHGTRTDRHVGDALVQENIS